MWARLNCQHTQPPCSFIKLESWAWCCIWPTRFFSFHFLFRPNRACLSMCCIYSKCCFHFQRSLECSLNITAGKEECIKAILRNQRLAGWGSSHHSRWTWTTRMVPFRFKSWPVVSMSPRPWVHAWFLLCKNWSQKGLCIIIIIIMIMISGKRYFLV